MAEKRADANVGKHPALKYIEAKGMTRNQAAELLGVHPKYLSQVLDRWRRTPVHFAKLFFEQFGIPYEASLNVDLRLPPKEFYRKEKKRKK